MRETAGNSCAFEWNEKLSQTESRTQERKKALNTGCFALWGNRK
jgi:hypothetical protein